MIGAVIIMGASLVLAWFAIANLEARLKKLEKDRG